MDIYVYSDESGVFDRQHNEYFVFGGLVALSYSEADEATRRYQHAEKLIKAKEGLANDDEAKACCLSNSGKSKLFRSLNNFHKFGVVIHQNRVNPNIFNNKKTKQRYLDYAFKIAIKRKFVKERSNHARSAKFAFMWMSMRPQQMAVMSSEKR